jgi:hypothetical protein
MYIIDRDSIIGCRDVEMVKRIHGLAGDEKTFGALVSRQLRTGACIVWEEFGLE